jgi:hypothetical protein
MKLQNFLLMLALATAAGQATADQIEIRLGSNSPLFFPNGATVEIPVRVTTISTTGDPADASQLAGLDFRFFFDNSLLELDTLTVSPTTSSWTMAYNPNGSVVQVSMATANPLDVVTSPQDVISVRFQVKTLVGESSFGFYTYPYAPQAFDINLYQIGVTPTSTQYFTGCRKGDPNRDGQFNSADGIVTLLAAVELSQLAEVDSCAADMNENGMIDAGDGVLVLQKAVGLIPKTSVKSAPASVSLTRGPAPYSVSIELAGCAGLSATLRFEESLTFESDQLLVAGFMRALNSNNPGEVRIATAGAQTRSGALHMFFSPPSSAATVSIADITAFDENGMPMLVDIGNEAVILAGETTGVPPTPSRVARLLPAIPNPFNPRTEVRFYLATAGRATIGIYDLAGRNIWNLSQYVEGGFHSVTWDGRDSNGNEMAAGVYAVRLSTSGTSDSQKIVLLK